MSMNRRQLIQASAVTGAALALTGSVRAHRCDHSQDQRWASTTAPDE